MKDQLNQILELDIPIKAYPALEEDFLKFQELRNVILPEDLKDYFRLLQNKKSEYNGELYRFFPLHEFKSINEELKNFAGTPDYSNIIHVLKDHEYCFVFADYMFHLFSYAIHLHNDGTKKNEIYVICGDKYKVVASSFTEFIQLYLTDSSKLHF